MTSFERAAARIRPPDDEVARAAADLHDRLTKPPGSLGRLEGIGVRLAALAGECPPPVPAPVMVAVFAGDHGVVAQGVTPWPQEVTAQMVANFCAGGAAVNVLAGHVGAEVLVVDVGVATQLEPHPRLLARNVRRGTGDLAVEPAMTGDEVRAALDVGVEVAEEAVARGARCLVTGDMGIGNTTPSAAVISAITGAAAAAVTGRGAGADDATLVTKVATIERALARLRPGDDPLTLLAELGGCEIAALTGFVVGGAGAGVPVVVDGVIALAAAVVADALVPAAPPWWFAGHRSTEPAASIALAHLGLDPLLDLGLRLGEGTGAILAVPLLQVSAMILRDMATFDSAGVTDKR